MKKRKAKSRREPLSRMKVEKGKIPSPWNALDKIAPTNSVSWYHDHLPDYLWLVLLTRAKYRTQTFVAFRAVLDVLHDNRQQNGLIGFSHQRLADLDINLFDDVFTPILAIKELREALRPLAVLDQLPGADRWRAKLGEGEKGDNDLIEAAVAEAAPQNSRPATDIAFLMLVNLIVQDRISFNPGLLDPADLDAYAFDPDSVPKISGLARSMRNGWLNHDREEADHNRDWVDAFYNWGRKSTVCRGIYISSDDDSSSYEDCARRIMAQLAEIRRCCTRRLTADFQTSGYNERREVLASLGLYATDIAISAGISGSASHAQGAILVRSLAEINILISHIIKDNTAVGRYRSYGAGRARLLAEKADEIGISANYLFLEELENVSNERRAAMFIDMPVNAFYKKSVRDTAIECGAKDVYDTYYDVGSMYAHAEWGGVATSSVQMCGNPLHLGHYIPSERLFAVEMLNDVEWLVQRIATELGVVSAAAASPTAGPS